MVKDMMGRNCWSTAAENLSEDTVVRRRGGSDEGQLKPGRQHGLRGRKDVLKAEKALERGRFELGVTRKGLTDGEIIG